MMAQPLEAGSPDKQALASVLNYLKDRRLKETEQALKRELGLEGASQMDTSSSNSPQLTTVSQSYTEPVKYRESYSRPAPTSSTSTMTDLQSARHAGNLETREPLSFEQPDDNPEEEEEEDEEEDFADRVSELQEGHRSVSWPGSLPNHHIKFPTVTNVLFNSDRAHFKARTAVIPSTFPSTSITSSSNPIPLWAVAASSTLKPNALTLNPSISSMAPTPPSVIYSMLPSQGMGLHSRTMLTPLLTIMPQGVLTGTTTGTTAPTSVAKPAQSVPLLISPTKPLSLPLFSAQTSVASSCVPATVASLPLGRESSFSAAGTLNPRIACDAEPSTGQTIHSPLPEQVKVLSQVPPQRTLASIPPSEMTPQYVELKAFAEEFKTKRIRLGYTQGSVGQSLARKGYSNFAQSTISRFEQMQLSATNATAIKLVLEKWLQETEFPESVSSSSSDTPAMASRKRKKRAVFTPQTKSTLDEFFHQNPRPNRQAIESISQQLDLLPEEVRVWFCNKRQKQKQTSTSSSTSSYYPAVSPTSSGFTSLRSPSLSPKRSSPSPKTSFTIEELSKSSANSSTSTSPVLLTSPFSISPSVLSLSATTGGGSVFPIMMPGPIFPHLTTTQTRA